MYLKTEIDAHKNEIEILAKEKEALENHLMNTNQSTNTALTNELHRIREEIKRHYVAEKNESIRMQNQITLLTTEKVGIEHQIQLLKDRLTEVGMAIGDDATPPTLPVPKKK